jgi:hypothetical protein
MTKTQNPRRNPRPQSNKPAASHPESMVANEAARPVQPPARVTKLAKLIAALDAPGGADLSALMGVTGWQSHSVRGALAGTLKKRMGLVIESEKREGVRFYRITRAEQA